MAVAIKRIRLPMSNTFKLMPYLLRRELMAKKRAFNPKKITISGLKPLMPELVDVVELTVIIPVDRKGNIITCTTVSRY